MHQAEAPRLAEGLLDQWPEEKLERYIEAKRTAADEHITHQRFELADIEWRFLDQASAALARVRGRARAA